MPKSKPKLHKPVRTVQGRDLKPGMFTDQGFILEIDFSNDCPFWEGPNYVFVDNNDSMGPCMRAFELDEDFGILFEKGTPEYKEHIEFMEASLVEDMKGLVDTIRQVMDLSR